MTEIVMKENTDYFQNVLSTAIKIPGVRINRTSFLRNTLSKYYLEDVVKIAVESNPAKAGITPEELNKIARSCINYETNKVAAISAAAGMPGGFGMAATIPADLTQYFAHIIRILQKLIYLYGWKDIFTVDEEIDDETLSLLTIFIGVMFGVQAANKLLVKISLLAAVRANKVLASKPLTKGVIYPIVKRIAVIITGKMNKKMFASGVSKIIPYIGALTSGGLTYIAFRPMCYRLKNHLESLPIASVDFYKQSHTISESDLVLSDFIESDFNIQDL